MKIRNFILYIFISILFLTFSGNANASVEGELYLEPSLVSGKAVGDTFTLQSLVNSGSKGIRDAIIEISFNPSMLSVSSGDCSAGPNYVSMSDYYSACSVTSGKIILRISSINISNPPSGIPVLANIRFTVAGIGESQINYLTNYSLTTYSSIGNPVGFQVNKVTNALFSSNAVLTPTPTATGVPGNPTPTVTGVPGSPTPTTTGGPRTPTPTTTGVPRTPTPTSTPPSGRENYVIDVGEKQYLTINIGISGTSPTPTPSSAVVTPGADVPYIKFSVKLFGTENSPDLPEIPVRLSLDDLNTQVNIPSSDAVIGDSCLTPGWGELFYDKIILIPDANKVYTPKPGSQYYHEGKIYKVDENGWVALDGANVSDTYVISLKGQKHRNMKFVDRIKFQSGRPSVQNFDWKATPLEPGDLHHPDNDKQDCVVNMVDMSLIQSRIRSESEFDWYIADVDYNKFINSMDVSRVIVTMQTKPDDD